jgi:hypothetical protein
MKKTQKPSSPLQNVHRDRMYLRPVGEVESLSNREHLLCYDPYLKRTITAPSFDETAGICAIVAVVDTGSLVGARNHCERNVATTMQVVPFSPYYGTHGKTRSSDRRLNAAASTPKIYNT